MHLFGERDRLELGLLRDVHTGRVRTDPIFLIKAVTRHTLSDHRHPR